MSQPESPNVSPLNAAPSQPSNATGRVWPVALVVVTLLGAAGWMLVRAGNVSKPPRVETAEGVALRKAQALVINEPSDANARAWERTARVYRVQRSKP